MPGKISLVPASKTKPSPPAIAARVNSFARTLRGGGYLISVRETANAIMALKYIDVVNEKEVRCALRCAFTSHHREWARFDNYFDAHWLVHTKTKTHVKSNLSRGSPSQQREDRTSPRRAANPLADHVKRMEKANGSEDNTAGKSSQYSASETETLASTDINQITDPSLLHDLFELAERLARRMRYRQLRRKRLDRRGSTIDIRKTIQKSVASGGIPIRLFHRKLPRKPFKLLIFLDVSGSMDQYSLFFMRFMHGLLGAFREADAFIFHTKLIEISNILKERSPIKVMERMALIAQGWSGGTKIGESLASFNNNYARSIMTSRTLVIIVSDGYDTGPASDLGLEIARLRRRTKRLIWLNPLLGWQKYQPICDAMTAALPHIDLFAPAHNLESLAVLEPEFLRV